MDSFLDMILCRQDAWAVKDDEKKLFDCIHMKFIVVTDLAIACKLSVRDLLQYASPKVYSNITYLLLLHECVVWLIDKSLCGLECFKDHILHKSWFHLIVPAVEGPDSAKF